MAGLWIWADVPTTPTIVGLPATGIAHNSDTGVPIIKKAQVRLADGGALTVDVDLNRAGGAPVGMRYQWYLNGHPLPGQTAAALPIGVAKQGDQVMVDITPNNGMIDGAVVKTPVFIVGNAAPTILKLRFEPAIPRTGDKLSVIAEVTDLDRHDVTLSFRWSKNGTLIQDGPSHQLAPEEFNRDDRVVVEVVPHDGHNEGIPVRSGEVTIGNGIPRITSTPTFSAQGATLQYVVTAVDPDHDPLTFTLTAAPPGMTIDKTTGRLVWTPTSAVKGPQRVRVEVRDGHDGMAPQEFDVAVPTSPAASVSPTL